MIDLADYYSGGYFLIRADNPEWYVPLKAELGIEDILSLSTCICTRVSVWWGWNPGDLEAALKFGVPAEKLDEFVEWCSDAHEVDIYHVSMFYSVDAARRFVARFLPNTDGLYLIGAGLYKPLEAAGWNLYPHQVKYEIEVDLRLQKERKPQGVNDQIELHLPLEAGGTPLGFEVICFWNFSDFADSWFCSNIPTHMDDLFGIKPGQLGLLQSREEAEKVSNWIMEGFEDENYRAEPEPYAYWLLVSYPLVAEG